MATSGKLETNYAYGVDDRWYLRCAWDVKESSISGNYTTINWTVSLITEGSSSWVYANDIYLNIAGNVYTIVGSRQQTYKGTLKSGTYTVYHNNTGEGSVWMSLEGAIYQSRKNASASNTFYLNNIPRSATITSAPNFTDESNPTIYYSNPAGSNVTSLEACISYDGSKDDIVYRSISKTGTSYTFNLTETEREKLRADRTQGKTKTVYFYVRTVIGGQTFTNYKAATLTIVNAEPIIHCTAKDTNPSTIALTGDSNILVKNKSVLSMEMRPSAFKHATIVDSQIYYDGRWMKGTTATWEDAPYNRVQFWTKDSRGYEKYATITMDAIEYFNPTCTITLGKPSAEGNIDFSIKGTFWNGNFGVSSNTVDVQYIVREEGASAATATGTWIKVPLTPTNNNINTTIKLTGLDYRKTYSIQAWVGDKLGEKYSPRVKFTTRPLFNWNKDRFNFNIPVEFNGSSMLDLMWPVGSIYTTVDKRNPENIFGGSWEPFAQGRTLMGVDPQQNGFKLPEYESGARYHTLTIDEMPPHYHRVINQGSNNNAGLWPTKDYIWGDYTSQSDGAYGNTGDESNKLTTTYEGKGQAYDQLPPYITVYFWKRIG